MKITRHTAKDMRQALKLVREQLGAEAVILTSKRTPFGVEVTAAIDFDAARVEAQATNAQAAAQAHPAAQSFAQGQPAAQPHASTHTQPAAPVWSPSEPRPFRPEEFAPPAPAAQPVRQPTRPEHDPYTIADRADADVQDSLFARIQAEMQQDAVVTGARARSAEAPATRNTSVRDSDLGVHAALENAIDSYLTPVDASAADEPLADTAPARAARDDSESSETSALSEELKAMRRILETQMAQLAWNDLTRRAPIHTQILTELTEVGLSQDFAAQIVAQLPPSADMIKARRLSISLIATRLNVTGDRWLDKGGRVALVGPTGVGKTTALAKLAVRWVLRHGARSLALISADSVRIGAHDQLQALGQMLDVPVLIAENLADVPKLLEQLGPKRFVLIDTPGMSQRDAHLATRLAQLIGAGKDAKAGADANGIETALVLSASTQAGAIAETVARYATAKVQSVLLTKVDEAASLGGVLSVLAKAELPISYVSEGQRVPEDLRPARSLELVSSAVQLAKTSGAAADEDLLRRRYGEVAHALA